MKKLILLFSLIFVTQTTPLPRLTITQNGYVLNCAITGKVHQGVTVDADNVVIRNCYVPDSNVNSGGIVINGDNSIIINNKVTNACMVGILIRGSNNLVEGNDISSSRQCSGSGADADGIRVFGNGHIIRDNYVHDISLEQNPTAHIDCIQSWGTLTNITIEGNVCDVAHAGIQTDSGYNVQDITVKSNVFIASRPLNVYGDGWTVTNNIFIGNPVTGFAGAYVSFRDSKDITFTNNVILNTTAGVLTQVGATTLGGNNVFWNDSGIAPRRDSGYNSNPLKWKTDKWQAVDPMLTADYFTGNVSVCYAGLGCTEIPITPTPTPTMTPTRTPTVTPTQTPICLPVFDVWVCNGKP